ncbi:metal-dependent hydrolase [Vallitalea guaymasensis]|uniref:metal-dependent hydrolase n=1 Tax=Vallitalea guaymasensis TaxID=1185412 RepID=UPI00272D03FD|nr:metal-dependent hydrolase [Vallitalea guaymasensis]
MNIKYLGHSAFYMEAGNYSAIIDPFITDNPQCTATVDDFNNLNHIFVTHGHGDHLGDAVELAIKTNATIITNFELGNYLLFNNKNISVHTMHIGGSTVIDGVSIKMTNALHGSCVITTDQDIIYAGNPCGFLINYDGIKIYHAGDTGLTLDMKLLEDEHVNAALLPIGGNFTMDIPDACKAVDFVKPDLAIPMHYNTFPPIKADPYKFQESASCKVKVMDINQVITI